VLTNWLFTSRTDFVGVAEQVVGCPLLHGAVCVMLFTGAWGKGKVKNNNKD
jgi:hypothetical protein